MFENNICYHKIHIITYNHKFSLKFLYSKKQIVDVVVDPYICSKLRPHQREGVQFMFDCIMGYQKNLAGNGCILADEVNSMNFL